MYYIKLFLLIILFISLSFSYAGERTFGGSSKNFNSNITRNKNSVDKNSTWQNNHGTGSKQTTKRWNKESKTASKNSVINTTQGKTYTTDKSTTFNDSGSASYKGITGPEGQTKSVNTERYRYKNEDGSFNYNTSKTTSGGKSLDTTTNFKHTDNGVVTSGSYTTGSGNTYNRDTTTEKTEDALLRSITHTNKEGDTSSRTYTIDVDR